MPNTVLGADPTNYFGLRPHEQRKHFVAVKTIDKDRSKPYRLHLRCDRRPTEPDELGVIVCAHLPSRGYRIYDQFGEETLAQQLGRLHFSTMPSVLRELNKELRYGLSVGHDRRPGDIPELEPVGQRLYEAVQNWKIGHDPTYYMNWVERDSVPGDFWAMNFEYSRAGTPFLDAAARLVDRLRYRRADVMLTYETDPSSTVDDQEFRTTYSSWV